MTRFAVALGLGLLVGQGLLAQSPPRLVPAVGVARDAAGNLHSGATEVTFLIYATQDGGDPLWKETQTLALDASGQYSTLLGLTEKEGLPQELFTEGAARWVAVSINGGPEGPRAFWASVPYALKAADAETIGGLPIEAFVVNGAYRRGDAPSVVPRADHDGMPADAPTIEDPDRPADQVIADDLIVQGSICSGIDCVNNENFGFDTLRLKENNTRIQFDDTSTSGGFPTNNWQIRANSSASGGTSFLGFVDQGATGNSETGTIVFQVEAGAPANSLFVDNTGRVGLRTSTPVLDTHTVTSNTPGLRLEQSNAGGFTAQTWDIAGNEASFFVRDVTNSSRLPFRIVPGAPTNSLVVQATGNLGVGTLTPAAGIHVNRAAGGFSNLMELTNNSGVGVVLHNTTRNRVYMSVNNPGTNFTLNFDDGDPAEFSLSETGALTGVTSCTGCSPPSDRNLKENFDRVDRDAVLKGLLGLDVSSWNYKSFSSSERHIGPMSQDFFGTFGVGNDVTLNPVDTFGVTAAAIQALSSQVSELQQLVADLQAEIERLKQPR